MAKLTTKYMGLELQSPLIAASSGLTENLDHLIQLQEAGAGAVVLKSIFEEEILLEKEARMKKMGSSGFLYPETVEFYEHQDHPEEITEKYIDLVQKAKSKINIPVIPSINCMTAGPWTYYPKQLEAVGADAIELNLFILPSDMNRGARENEQVYFDIVKSITEQISIPVALKISYYFSNLAEMLQKLSETGIGALVLFNRFYSPDFDLDRLEVTSGNVLSNPGDLFMPLRWIAISSGKIKCDIAGTTGVYDGFDAVKLILAGANAVQVASALYKLGVGHVKNIISQIETWMDNKGFKTIDDFRGKLNQKNIDHPAAFERVQFMKYFRGYPTE